jgi:hypothetical protein
VRAKARAAAGTFSYRVVAKRKDIAAPRFEKVTLSPEYRVFRTIYDEASLIYG